MNIKSKLFTTTHTFCHKINCIPVTIEPAHPNLLECSLYSNGPSPKQCCHAQTCHPHCEELYIHINIHIYISYVNRSIVQQMPITTQDPVGQPCPEGRVAKCFHRPLQEMHQCLFNGSTESHTTVPCDPSQIQPAKNRRQHRASQCRRSKWLWPGRTPGANPRGEDRVWTLMRRLAPGWRAWGPREPLYVMGKS